MQYPLKPKYPEGTPEHAEYRRKLMVELEKFKTRQPPYDKDFDLIFDIDEGLS